MNVMIGAVRKAARSLQRDYGELSNLQVSQKAPGDYVTAVDRASETAIRELLAAETPEVPMVGEEEGGSAAGGRYWLVDPLDGTTNFLHGLPQFSVSIALAERGVLSQAVVYDPSRNELFTASRGAGAFLNDRRLRVSRRTRLKATLVGGLATQLVALPMPALVPAMLESLR